MKYFISAITAKYANFSGRASRAEYWNCVLFFFLAGLVIGFVVGLIGGAAGMDPNQIQVFAQFINLPLLIPAIAVGVRRMHDTGHSGWFILLPIVNFIFAVTPGTSAANEYGPDPYALEMPEIIL